MLPTHCFQIWDEKSVESVSALQTGRVLVSRDILAHAARVPIPYSDSYANMRDAATFHVQQSNLQTWEVLA